MKPTNKWHDESIIGFDGFRIDPAKRLLFNGDVSIALMPKAFDTLLYLAENSGRVVGKDELLREVWSETIVEENNLTQNISVLRKVLGEGPREHRFIATVPGQGYKFVSDVRKIEQVNEPASISDEEQPENANGLFGTLKGRFWFFTLAFVIVTLGWLGVYLTRDTVGKSPFRTIAVLPFVNGGEDPNAEYLSDGIAESVINNLSGISGLRVMSRNSAFRFKSNQSDIISIARTLGVETLMTGDIRQIGEQFVINVRLVDGSDDTQIWGGRYIKDSADIIAAQNEIAQAIASNLRLKLTNVERQQLAKNYTKNADAYQLYLRGRFHYFKIREPEIHKSIVLYQQAIDLDPNYALAYAGIADSYRTLPLAGWSVASKEGMPRARTAAEKALEIDENLAEAHVALGWVHFLYDWDWLAAEKSMTRAIELAPYNADAHRSYAHLLSNTGRHDEAIEQIRRARELDPLSLIINALEGQFLFYAGRDTEAIDRLKKTMEIEPNFWIAHNAMGRVYLRQERFDEAITSFTRAKEVSVSSIEPVTQLAYALAKSGNREHALAILEDLKSSAKTHYVPAYSFAMIYNGLDETDKSLGYLEQSLSEREVHMSFIKIDSRWDNLRGEPRFAKTMKKMNF